MPIDVNPVGDAFGWDLHFRFHEPGVECNRVYSGAGQHSLAEWFAFLQDPRGVLSAQLWRKDGLLHLGENKDPHGQRVSTDLVVAEDLVLARIRSAVSDAQKAGMLFV